MESVPTTGQPPRRSWPFESGTIFRLRAWQWALFWPVAIFVSLYLRSLRMRICPDEASRFQSTAAPRVLVTWHNRSLLAPEIARRFFPPDSVACLISPSRRAAWQVAFYEYMRMIVIRGSSSRRGIAAMRESVAALRSGRDMAISPDGPIGPLYEIKRGAVTLARMSASPVVFIVPNARCAWRLRTWDRHLIPLPFSRVEVRMAFAPAPEISKQDDESLIAWNALLASITEDR
ncbi:MAG: DUF374 domain-containing protein [Opitutales bacterium]|nr:DUF374 domain-containing protein [Opitutales bacterium]